MNTTDYDGMALLDSAGEQLGTVEHTYVNDSGEARYIATRYGGLLPKHRLVPADGAQLTDDGLRVPYERATIEESPSIDAGDTLEPEAIERISEYYDGITDANAEPVLLEDDTVVGARPLRPGDEEDADDDDDSTPASSASAGPGDGNTTYGEPRDLGDVIEIPIYEEVLVKKQVVREVLRVRKTWASNPQTVEGDLRTERVEVEQDGDVVVRGEPTSVPADE